MAATEKACSHSPLGGAFRAFFAIAFVALLALVISPSFALADDASDELSNDEVLELASLDGSATTEGLEDGQVQVTVSSTNNSGAAIPGHLVEFEAPDGWELVSGSLTSSTQTTEGGDTLSTSAVFKKGSGSSSKTDGDGGKTDDGSSKKTGVLPGTGDTLKWAIVLAAGVLLVLVGRKLRLKGMMVLILVLVMVMASYPVPALQAFADEIIETDDGPSSGEDVTADYQPLTASKTLELTAGDIKLSVKAKVTFLVAGERSNAGVINLDISNNIAKNTTKTVIVLESVTPFALKENLSTKDGKARINEISGKEANGGNDDVTVSDFGYFDSEKIEFTGALEGVTLRGNPIAFKTTSNDEYAKNNLDDEEDTAHYELWCAVDDINLELYNEDDPYGYISFAEGSFAESDVADESYTGIACVAFSAASPSIIQATSKDEALGSDAMTHTYENGEFWDGNNKFRVGINLDGLSLGMPLRDGDTGYDGLTSESYTIAGSEGHTYKQITKQLAVEEHMVSVLNKDTKVVPTAIDWDDANLWVEFTVEGKTGQEAYDAFTACLSRGVRISPSFAAQALTYGIEVYPDGLSGQSSDSDSTGFAYAESSPAAFVWATDYKESGDKTEITYLASVHGASDLADEDGNTLATVSLKQKTTFKAEKAEITASEDDESDASNVSGDSSTSGMEIVSASVVDAGNNVMQIKLSVPTEEFNETLGAFSLDEGSNKNDQLAALYSYVGGIELTMTNGSANAFGVEEANKQVKLIDAAALTSSLSSSETVALADDGQDSETPNVPTTPDEVKTDTEELINNLKINASNTHYKKVANQAIESGKSIYTAISQIIQAYKDSSLGLSVLGPVGAIAGAAISFVGSLSTEGEVVYTVDDVMNKLDELESQISDISTATSVISLQQQETERALEYDTKYAERLEQLNNYMGGKQMTDLIKNLQTELAKYEAKDDKGKSLGACSLATPIKYMPKEAVALVRKFVDYANKFAKLQAGAEGAEGALNMLYVMIKPTTSHVSNVLDSYFNYTENFYNWESETYTARLALTATLSQMWINAYMVASADLALQDYDLESNEKGEDDLDRKMIKSAADDLQDKTNAVMEVLYGKYDWDTVKQEYPTDTTQKDHPQTSYNLELIEHGKYQREFASKMQEYEDQGMDTDDAFAATTQYILDTYYYTESDQFKRTHSDGSGYERLLVMDANSNDDDALFSPTYTTDSGTKLNYYGKVAAYDKSCFANSYWVDVGVASSSDSIINRAAYSTWSANSSFTAWQIKQMVKRLKALPDALRPVYETTDDQGNAVSRAVENVDEELQALGFKSINTSPEKNYKLKVAGMDRTTEYKYTYTDAIKKYWGVVDVGTDENPTPLDQEVVLNANADENQNWPFVMTDIGGKYTTADKYGPIRLNYWTELGGSSESLLGINSNDRIKHSNDWVITKSGNVVDGARNSFGKWHSKSRYGTVVNYKDGTIKENQLLYTVDAEYYPNLVRWYEDGNWFQNLFNRIASETWITRVEFYAFGVFDLTTKSAWIYKGAGTGFNNQFNLYYSREYLKSTLYTYGKYRLENSYWTVDKDGRLFPTEEGIVSTTSRADPNVHYKYKEK